jgi:Tfp pilus assembly protein PilN
MKRMNLLPRRWSLPRIHSVELSKRTREAFLACAAAIALLSIVSFLEKRRILAAEAEYQQVRARYAEVVQREEAMHAAAQTLASLGTLARTVDDVRTDSARRIALLTHLGDGLPDGVWLTGISAAQSTIDVQGRGRDAAAVGAALQSIERDRRFRQPRLLHARAHDQTGSHYIDFEFSAGTTGERI